MASQVCRKVAGQAEAQRGREGAGGRAEAGASGRANKALGRIEREAHKPKQQSSSKGYVSPESLGKSAVQRAGSPRERIRYGLGASPKYGHTNAHRRAWAAAADDCGELPCKDVCLATRWRYHHWTNHSRLPMHTTRQGGRLDIHSKQSE